MQRRQFMAAVVASAAASQMAFCVEKVAPPTPTKGVVLYPFDLSLTDWPVRASKAGINTIALHAARRLDVLTDFIASPAGKYFLAGCAELGIAVEYELHAMGELLSREWYYKNPEWFRQDEHGSRNPDANCCPHSPQALEIIAAKAVHYGKLLRPTTSRYFYWPDDGAQWCHCSLCKEFSASEQALLVENKIVKALRTFDPAATLSHISYHHTLSAPVKVKPEPGIFLEFAPIDRAYSMFEGKEMLPISKRDFRFRPTDKSNGELLDFLDANLAVFPVATAQVLEYWLDASLASGWQRPVKALPWSKETLVDDLATYRTKGILHFTTFATYIDATYVKLHGDPQAMLQEYGSALAKP